MTSDINNRADVIDSRDFIERLEELQAERDGFKEALQDAQDALDEFDPEAGGGDEAELKQAVADTERDLATWAESPEAAELEILEKVAAEASDSPDWEHGEALIRESYFTDYIEELITDCYEMPKALKSGEWPWRHVKVDYVAAAEEAKADYLEVDFDGVTYLIRA